MSRKQLIIYIFSALLVFIGFVMARFPANTALAIVSKQSGMVISDRVSGTVWQGRAENLYLRTDDDFLPLGVTHWDISFWPMLTGRLVGNINAVSGSQKISGHFTAGINSLRLRDMELAVDINQLLQFYPVPIRAEGFVELMLPEFAFDGREINALDGSILVRDLEVNFTHPVKLGSFAARLGMEDNAVQASISDIDATVAVEGTASLVLTERHYSVDINMKPGAGADQAITQTLRTFTREQADGSYQFQQNQQRF